MVRRLDIARLRRQLRAEWKTTDREALLTVLARHARLSGNGQPMRCTPSREQLAAGHPGGLQSAYKIIYDNRAAARACERELHKTFGGPRQRAHVCPRSRHGHFHLTRQGAPGS